MARSAGVSQVDIIRCDAIMLGVDVVMVALNEFCSDLQRVFERDLLEVFIHGSYCLGDFRLSGSDLDYIAVVEEDLSDPQIAAVMAMHDRYREQADSCLRLLEGTTYPARVLADPSSPCVGAYVGTSRTGWRKVTSFANEMIDLVTVEQGGLDLLKSGTEVYHPTKTELKEEMLEGADRMKIAIGQTGFPPAVAVHWCARNEYFMAMDVVPSKTVACDWYAETCQRDTHANVARAARDARYPYLGSGGNRSDSVPVEIVAEMVEVARQRIMRW